MIYVKGRRRARHNKAKSNRIKDASVEQRIQWAREGGLTRALLLTKEERVHIAKLAANSRWKNKAINLSL